MARSMKTMRLASAYSTPQQPRQKQRLQLRRLRSSTVHGSTKPGYAVAGDASRPAAPRPHFQAHGRRTVGGVFERGGRCRMRRGRPSISGSNNSLRRQALRSSNVPRSSRSISVEYPTTSAAKMAARRRSIGYGCNSEPRVSGDANVWTAKPTPPANIHLTTSAR